MENDLRILVPQAVSALRELATKMANSQHTTAIREQASEVSSIVRRIRDATESSDQLHFLANRVMTELELAMTSQYGHGMEPMTGAADKLNDLTIKIEAVLPNKRRLDGKQKSQEQLLIEFMENRESADFEDDMARAVFDKHRPKDRHVIVTVSRANNILRDDCSPWLLSKQGTQVKKYPSDVTGHGLQ